MKKFESLIKVKTIYLNDLNTKFVNISNKIDELNLKIERKNKNIDLYLNEYSLEILSVIDKIKKEIKDINDEIILEVDKLNNLKQEIITIKQEIRALELLIEKRKLEVLREKEKMEQNDLDELNSLD